MYSQSITFPIFLSTFKEAYPHIDIIMYTGLSYKLYHDFLEGRLHAAIIRGAHTWQSRKNIFGPNHSASLTKRLVPLRTYLVCPIFTIKQIRIYSKP